MLLLYKINIMRCGVRQSPEGRQQDYYDPLDQQLNNVIRLSFTPQLSSLSG